MGKEKKQKSFHLAINSRTDNLNRARNFVADVARQFGFSDEDIGKIQLAVDEACTNIIKHAYKGNPERSIEIDITISNTLRERPKFVIQIQDTGAAFNRESYHGPDMTEYFKKYRVGGLGILLMNKLMDEVSYNTNPGKPNQVMLVKYLPG